MADDNARLISQTLSNKMDELTQQLKVLNQNVFAIAHYIENQTVNGKKK